MKSIKIPKSKPNVINEFGNRINKDYLSFLISFDKQISRNLHESAIRTRVAESNGIWCCTLLPAVLIIYNIICKVSPVYSIVAYISLGLLFDCILFALFLSVSCLVLQEYVFGGCLAASLVSTLLMYIFGIDLTNSLLLTLPTVVASNTLIRVILTRFQNTFTIGEAMVVSQSIVLYVAMTVSNIFYGDIDEELDLIFYTVNTVLSSVGIIVTALCLMTEKQRNLLHLRNVVAATAVFALVMIHTLAGIYCVPRLFRYVFMDKNRVKLFAFWLAILAVTLFVLLFRTKLAVKATTVTRKSFHILASTVFLSGILFDRNLMTLAAGVGLGLLILVEGLRKSGIEPISSALQSAFLVYSDEKDGGSFAMTPLYLYCGLACPLVLVPRHASSALEQLAGVLAVGVGDTAASWFGSHYGFNKWTGSNKTFEGTIFNIFCQISTVYALQLFELLDVRRALFRSAVAATASGLSEALTDQVDNLVLPLITILGFQVTWFLY